jgi:broad specificity phosphatase PhoE
MRTLYLIRHGQTQSGNDGHRCISETDALLDEMGLYQAERLHKWVQTIQLTAIFSSPLQRCIQTAEIMADRRIPATVCGQLREMCVGAWENLTFDEIRIQHPEEYASRGRHPGTVPPPGGESFAHAGARLIDSMKSLMADTQGDIAIIAHGGINRGALCQLMGMHPDEVLTIDQPWGGINTLRMDEHGRFTVVSVGEKPDRWPAGFEREKLFQKYKTPLAVKAHCSAVSAKATALASQVMDVPVNIELLQAACDLHDMARDMGSGHALRGSELLLREGYPDVAKLVAAHHDLPEDAGVEMQLLYLADKLVLGTENVSLEKRFAASLEQCQTPQAIESWQRRLYDAYAIAARYHFNVGDC